MIKCMVNNGGHTLWYVVNRRGVTSIVLFLLIVVSALCSPQADAFMFGQKGTLKQVKKLFCQENYAQIYKGYLFRIPSFNPNSETSEALFYYYALTCTYLGKFDEAEGYLYTIRTKKQVLSDPAQYEYCWAHLKDFRGDLQGAYDRYQFFVKLYPAHVMVPYAYYRIGNLALALGLFQRGEYFFQYLIEHYPMSQYAQLIKRTDDLKPGHYMIVLGGFESEGSAEARLDQLQAQGVDARIHITTKWGEIYYLVVVGEYLHRSNAEMEFKKYVRYYDKASIYPPLVEVKVVES